MRNKKAKDNRILCTLSKRNDNMRVRGNYVLYKDNIWYEIVITKVTKINDSKIKGSLFYKIGSWFWTDYILYIQFNMINEYTKTNKIYIHIDLIIYQNHSYIEIQLW